VYFPTLSPNNVLFHEAGEINREWQGFYVAEMGIPRPSLSSTRWDGVRMRKPGFPYPLYFRSITEVWPKIMNAWKKSATEIWNGKHRHENFPSRSWKNIIFKMFFYNLLVCMQSYLQAYRLLADWNKHHVARRLSKGSYTNSRSPWISRLIVLRQKKQNLEFPYSLTWNRNRLRACAIVQKMYFVPPHQTRSRHAG
jgi:hypothetical protein